VSLMVHGNGEQYKVRISQKELEKLKRWGQWAAAAGVLDDYLVALKTVNYRLAFEPLEWGEPKYRARKLNLAVRLGTCKMLDVWYGVHLQKPIVFVKIFQFRGDYPVGQPPETP
jgi:hypothetical protein